MTNKFRILYRGIAGALMSLAIVAAPESAVAFDASIYTGKSKLSSDKWVKVRVSQSGMQQITYDQLREWGFSDPSKVYVYGYGGARHSSGYMRLNDPDDLSIVPEIHTNDSRLLFYGEADVTVRIIQAGRHRIDRNKFSKYGYYYLSDREPEGFADISAYDPSDREPLTNHRHLDLFEDEVTTLNHNGGYFWGKEANSTTAPTFTLPLKDFDSENSIHDPASLTFSVVIESPTQGVWPRTASITAQLESDIFTIDVNAPLQLYERNEANGDFVYGVPESAVMSYYPAGGEAPNEIPDGEYNASLEVVANATISKLSWDYRLSDYLRRNIFHREDGQMLMNYGYISQGQVVSVKNGSNDTHIWDVSDTGKPLICATNLNLDENTINFTSPRTYNANTVPAGYNCNDAKFIVFDETATFPGVEFVEQVAAQNIHGDPVPDMMIVCTKKLYPYAQELARIHYEHDGTLVNVYTQEMIYNEFSSGTPSVQAIRRAAKMFYDRDASKFKSLCYYGPAHWDMRAIMNQINPEEYMPIYGIEAFINLNPLGQYLRHPYLNFCTDGYAAWLNDDFDPEKILTTPQLIGVGRIPAADESQAFNANAKIRNYLANPLSAGDFAHMLLVSDDGDSNGHINQSEEVASTVNSVRSGFTFTRAHDSIYPRTLTRNPSAVASINNALSSGVGFMTYSGHGQPTFLTAQNLISLQSIKTTKYNKYPFVMLATCNAYPLDRLKDGIGQSLVVTKDGGAIGAIASCREVYMYNNQVFNLKIVETYAGLKEPTSIGEIYRLSHNKVHDTPNPANWANTLCFNLSGDPAVKIYPPSLNVRVTEVGGHAVNQEFENGKITTSSDPVEVAPYAKINVKGEICDLNGDKYSNFNGKATVTLYESPFKTGIIALDQYDLEAEISLDEKVLASTVAEVVNGEYSASLLIPRNTYSGDFSRLTVSADNNERTLAAIGVLDNIYVSDDPNEMPELDAPQITEFYIDNSSFTDGDHVKPDMTVFAEIDGGGIGINRSSLMGYSTTLTLDNRQDLTGANSALTLNTDGTASFALALTEVAEGPHTLTLSIPDNLGNRIERSIKFTVINQNVNVALTADRKTANDEIVFDFESGYTANPTVHLLVADRSGNIVFRNDNASMPYTWNVCDNKGARVADGFYRAYIMTESDEAHTSSESVSFAVIK